MLGKPARKAARILLQVFSTRVVHGRGKEGSEKHTKTKSKSILRVEEEESDSNYSDHSSLCLVELRCITPHKGRCEAG